MGTDAKRSPQNSLQTRPGPYPAVPLTTKRCSETNPRPNLPPLSLRPPILQKALSFEHIVWWSGRNPRPGRPRGNMNDGNRCDIVILSPRGRPIHVVEVKRNWDEDNSLLDLRRIRDLLLECGPARDGSLKRGYLTFMIQSSGENAGQSLKNLSHERSEIQEGIYRRFNPNGLQMKFHCGAKRRWPRRYKGEYNLDWFSCPFCVELIAIS